MWRAVRIAIGVFLLLLIALAGGWYSGLINTMTLVKLAGAANGQIVVVNLTDAPLQARLRTVATGEDSTSDRKQPKPLEQVTFGGLERQVYVLEFQRPEDSEPWRTCTLRIGFRDRFVFAAVPAGVAVTREGDESSEAAQMRVVSSSLCRQEGA